MEDAPGNSTQPIAPPDRLIVGRVVRPWGLSGQVKVELLTDFPERFSSGKRFFIGARAYVCRDVRRLSGAVALKLEGVESLEEADQLRGALLEVPIDEAHPLPQGTYYYHQVLGLEVWSTDGERLGRITDILATSSNDVYVVNGPRGELLIPAIGDVLVAVDLEAGRLTVQVVPGLL